MRLVLCKPGSIAQIALIDRIKPLALQLSQLCRRGVVAAAGSYSIVCRSAQQHVHFLGSGRAENQRRAVRADIPVRGVSNADSAAGGGKCISVKAEILRVVTFYARGDIAGEVGGGNHKVAAHALVLIDCKPER